MNIKLQDILIDIGKEAEKIKSTDLYTQQIINEFEQFIMAVDNDNAKSIRKHGIRLNALVAKYIIDNF